MKKLAISLMILTTISFVGCTQGNKKLSNAPTNNAQQTQTTDQNQNTQPNTGTQQTQGTQQTTATDKTQNNQNEYFFSQAKQHPDQELIKIINSSKSNLDIAINSIQKKEIVNAILQAKKRGVNVRIITDKQQATYKYERTELAMLSNAKIPIKINNHKGFMELRVTIIDKKVITTGSYNYNDEATINNDDVLEIISDIKVAENFESQFQRMWSDTKGFTNIKI